MRICVVDLADVTVYANADGDALKRRLTQGVPQPKPSIWAKLFGRGSKTKQKRLPERSDRRFF